MPKVTVLAKLKARPGLEERVRSELMEMVQLTRREKGCINYDLHVSTDEPGTFFFYENWVSQLALDDHFETPHLKRLRQIQGEILSEPAEIRLLTMVSEPE